LALTAQFTSELTGEILSKTAKGQDYFSPVYIDDATGEPLIAIAIPVKNVVVIIKGPW